MRVLLVDDHAVYRQQLRSLLEAEPDFEVVAEAASGKTALRLATDFAPDVVLMDVAMPELGGIEATRQIVATQPGVAVIALSMHREPAFVRAMLDAGACAYRTKDGAFSELLSALRSAVAGEAPDGSEGS